MTRVIDNGRRPSYVVVYVEGRWGCVGLTRKKNQKLLLKYTLRYFLLLLSNHHFTIIPLGYILRHPYVQLVF